MKLRSLIAAITVMAAIAADNAVATTFDINQSGIAWTPSTLTIHVGDTVNWVWSSGAHTVTNGASPSDAGVGTLFDSPLSSSAPMFSHTFVSSGIVPFFCRPHFSMGMTGVITVEEQVSDESTSWGAIKSLFR